MDLVDKYLQVETLSVVLLGDFNPIIFQPTWLANKGLIRLDEAENANVEIIHNEIAKFDLGWIYIEITKSRCMFKTSMEPYFKPLKDLVSGIFKILKETPINAIGINHIYDLGLQDDKKYYKFGASLTPLNYWESDLTNPKLLQLEIFEHNQDENNSDSRRIKIASSDKIATYGVIFSINNHFTIGTPRSRIFEVLENLIDKTRPESKKIIKNIFSQIEL